MIDIALTGHRQPRLFDSDPYSLKIGKDGRKILAQTIQQKLNQELHYFFFAACDGKLTNQHVSDKVKIPEDSKRILEILNGYTYGNI